MNQRFVGPVEQVAAGDIHNYPATGRALTKGERIALNAQVRQLEECHGEAGWRTWRFLHRVIGVDNLDAMRIEHRDVAEELLGLLLKCAQLQAAVCAIEASGAPAGDESHEKLAVELKQMRRALGQAERQLVLERRRSDLVLDELTGLKVAADRSALKLSRAIDELSAAKRELQHLTRRKNRFRGAALLFCALFVGALVWVWM